MDQDTPQHEKEMDSYTQEVLERGVSRRSFLSRTALGAAGVGLLGVAGLGTKKAEAAQGTEALEFAKSSDGGATLSFLPKPNPISDKEIKTTLTFDVIVVGAGASGVPAALSAAENGAKVAVIQKHPMPISQGNTGSGIDLATSEKAGIEALVAKLMADNNHRCNPALLRQWAYNSGEAVRWVINRAKQAGSPVVDQGTGPQHGIAKVNGYTLNYVTSFFGPKPYTAGDGMRHLAKTAEKAGVKFFFNMPAQQLVQSKSGEVVGVIAKGRDGKYTKFLAKKGVILATGDYQNNEAMCNYFIPDLKHFGRKQMDRTGDGFAMAYWAGGVIEPIGHTKMLHDFDAGPASMCDMPFLAVNREGKRFVNETVDMSLFNNYLRDAKNAGHYSQIFDANYMTQAAKWPGKLVPPEGLKNYMPDDPSPKKGVFDSLINTHVADTLEELARKLEIDPKNFVASVKRYNEVVASGKDSDFGKPADRLIPVLQAPFYGIHRRVRVSTICSGILVNENHQALDADGKPIKGLYAIGNLGGGFYGGVDYPLTVFGLSLGRCYTFGYLTGKHVAKL
ncbi:fumarate reductase [Geomonas silvestris]|uniref:Fumarate reductase n=1 Tax=Geomonas silvestris TaxID=2740184 RepID=A0A6V8MDA6_9BACT|nr:FAD-binding protein [Geomonas silvestris]GFO57884.1 fumarate reductase [Geomonas silvestris]